MDNLSIHLQIKYKKFIKGMIRRRGKYYQIVCRVLNEKRKTIVSGPNNYYKALKFINECGIATIHYVKKDLILGLSCERCYPDNCNATSDCKKKYSAEWLNKRYPNAQRRSGRYIRTIYGYPNDYIRCQCKQKIIKILHNRKFIITFI